MLHQTIKTEKGIINTQKLVKKVLLYFFVLSKVSAVVYSTSSFFRKKLRRIRTHFTISTTLFTLRQRISVFSTWIFLSFKKRIPQFSSLWSICNWKFFSHYQDFFEGTVAENSLSKWRLLQQSLFVFIIW